MRFVPKREAPTRHPRRGAAGSIRTGDRLIVQFSAVDPGGAAVARLGSARLSVPFGVPGEEAVVEVTRGGRRAEGRLVALQRKVEGLVAPRCRHFGACGGCQWQHLAPDIQRRLKTRLVKDYLKEHAEVRRDLVADTVAADVDEAWAYRNTLRAVFASRGERVVLGFHAAGAPHVLDISQCPVQHPANEAAALAAAEAIRALRLPAYDRARRHGLVRGLLTVASFTTGEVVALLSTAGPLPSPTDVVHAFISRLPALAGLLLTVQPRPTSDLVGRPPRLLWGRDHVTDEIAGYRLRLRPVTELPANPRALRLLVEAVVRAAALGPQATAVDLTARSPLFALALADRAEAATGVVAGKRALADAWQAAKDNGIANAFFTGRDAHTVLTGLSARRPPDVVVVTAEGGGLERAAVEAVATAGVRRVVYLARSLATCAKDLGLWRRLRYDVAGIQPVDLLPHTSHVHLVVTLRAAG